MQEIDDIRSRMENFVPIAQQDMQKKQEELYKPVQERIQNAIKAVGEEKGYTYILDPQVFLFTGDNAVNATQLVRAKLGI
jgi:outer membrane protein